jgi:periplasmic copper chaperone A
LNRRSVALLCCALVWQASIAAPAKGAGPPQVSDAWSRPTPPGIAVGAVYLTIENAGAVADRLLTASSPIAATVEFHQSVKTGGIMSMRAVPFIECPAGAVVKIAPGGLHIMLTGLKGPLVLGSSYPITLQFRDAGRVSVTVSVQARD